MGLRQKRIELQRPLGRGLHHSERFVWTGGAIGLLAAQLTYWKLQTQDWWRERALA